VNGWHVLIVGLWAVVIVQAALIVVLYRQVGIVILGQSSARTRDGLPISAVAPDWEAPDQDGQLRRLADFRGRPLVLVFAEPGCGPCRALMPELQRFYEENSDRTAVVVVASEDGEVNGEMARAHLNGIPVLTQDDQRISREYRIAATPFSYAIDADGTIQAKGIVNYEAQLELQLSDVETPERAEVPA
jgi:peroxiredoxin